MNLHTVSHQWRTRPDDQRFLSLTELAASVRARRQGSYEKRVDLQTVSVKAQDDELVLLGEDGRGASMTHWSFGQLCSLAGAPAAYMRTLPPELAQIPLQYSLEQSISKAEHSRADSENPDGESSVDSKLLLFKNGHWEVRAFTSPTYGRIWDLDVVEGVQRRCGPEWKVPGASYAAHDPRRATTLYASDRDIFLFLCCEDTPVEFDGETLFRGFYTYNSEVGSATFGLATFLYDRVCDNRIVWGVQNFRELKIPHRSRAPERWLQEAAPKLSAWANAKSAPIAQLAQKAKALEVAKDQGGVVDWLRKKGFTQTLAAAAYKSAEQTGRFSPRSLWGLVEGLTNEAREIPHTDQRTRIEEKAGHLLDLVA